jgi:hypothetical protein
MRIHPKSNSDFHYYVRECTLESAYSISPLKKKMHNIKDLKWINFPRRLISSKDQI